jgi:hypothetical protein
VHNGPVESIEISGTVFTPKGHMSDVIFPQSPVNTQVYIPASAMDTFVNVNDGLSVPIFTPSFCHWYDRLLPVAVSVKV